MVIALNDTEDALEGGGNPAPSLEGMEQIYYRYCHTFNRNWKAINEPQPIAAKSADQNPTNSFGIK
jgi:hypothetical protein